MVLSDFFDTGERTLYPCNPSPCGACPRFRMVKPALAPVPSTARESGGSGVWLELSSKGKGKSCRPRPSLHMIPTVTRAWVAAPGRRTSGSDAAKSAPGEFYDFDRREMPGPIAFRDRSTIPPG